MTYAVARPVSIAPSVLPADFSRLGEDLVALEKAGVDRIQWDVMDGRFVPNLTFGPDVIASCRSSVTVPFEAHLMVEEPDELMHRYVEAGCELVIVHAEACRHLHRTLGRLRELGASPAVALNPATPASAVRHVLDLVDMVLVMTVNPGFGGQAYIATMEPKVAEIRRWIVDGGHDVDLEVDGGVGPDTVAGAAAAGANVLVAGSALFRDPAGLEHAVTDLRARAEAAAVSALTVRHAVPVVLAVLLACALGACHDDGSRDEFCAELPGAIDVVGVLGDFDSDDSAALEKRFADGLEQFEALEDSAPAEIRDDVKDITAAVELILAAVRAHPDDTAAIREELADDAETIDAAAEAAVTVNDYARTECNLDLTTVSTVATTATTAPPTTG